MRVRSYAQNILIGTTAALFAGTRLVPGHDRSGPVLVAASAFVTAKASSTLETGPSAATARAKAALAVLTGSVRQLSHPAALDDAFRSYYAFRGAHPDQVKKPLLYFVDYGLPSTTPRGYVFDMDSLKVVEGPFTVAHGRGSSAAQYGIPTRFSNASGSAATSLGLYIAKSLYDFHGHSGGRAYSSVGLRLVGVSAGFNDKALARGVVAHGAPYVTADKAGRSEGCPAIEPGRAKELLPKLADGGMVFLFAPNSDWMNGDPWLTAASDESAAATN